MYFFNSKLRKRLSVVILILAFLPFFIIPAIEIFKIQSLGFLTLKLAMPASFILIYLSRMLYCGTWKINWKDWPW